MYLWYMEKLRYPIGKFSFDVDITPEKRAAWIGDIERLPGELRRALSGLSAEQLDTPYREGGWTVRQLAHHIADSHMNSFIRVKLALTESNPTIKPYDQDEWVTTADVTGVDVELSLVLLEGLHARWTRLLASLPPSDFARTFNHPEIGMQTLDRQLQLYAWHGRHHVAHIVSLRERKDW
jgi:uncharacterized damage-inducible protein DinB